MQEQSLMTVFFSCPLLFRFIFKITIRQSKTTTCHHQTLINSALKIFVEQQHVFYKSASNHVNNKMF